MAAQSKRIGESKIIAAKAEVNIHIKLDLSHIANRFSG
jgi:hypothetical protein